MWQHAKDYVFADNSVNDAVYQTFAGNWGDTNADPKFVDITNSYTPSSAHQPDLRLQSNSPCIDNGAFLTTIIGSGTGTNFVVADAGFFFDGYGVVPGDTIQLQGQGAAYRAIITSVNLATKTITFTPALT